MIFNLFKYLEKNKVDFALTNGYIDVETQKDTEADIDMIFRKKDFKVIERILKEFCLLNKLQLVQVLHHDLYAKNIFLFDPSNCKFLNLDIYAEFSRKGILFFDEKDVFDTLNSYKGIPTVSYEKEFLGYLYKKLDKNDLSLENFKYLSELFFRESLCLKEIERFFPKTFSFILDAFNSKNIEIILKIKILYLKMRLK